MAGIGFFELLIILIVLLGLGAGVLWLWMLIDCIASEPAGGDQKLLWILIIVLTGAFGALLYLLLRRPARIREAAAADPATGGAAAAKKSVSPGVIILIIFFVVIVPILGLVGIAGAFLWVGHTAANERRGIDQHLGYLGSAIEQDRFVEYRTALKAGEKALAIDDSDPLALSAMAYTHAVLAYEHGEEKSVALADEYLQRANNASSAPDAWGVAAMALIANHKGKHREGLMEIGPVADKSSRPSILLEYFKLLLATDPDGEKTKKALQQVHATVSGQARVYNSLGWYYYARKNDEEAERFFGYAAQNVPRHEPARIGLALVSLNRGSREGQEEINADLEKVLSAPPAQLSRPVRALAHFARSRLYLAQNRLDEAEHELARAKELAGDDVKLPTRADDAKTEIKAKKKGRKRRQSRKSRR